MALAARLDKLDSPDVDRALTVREAQFVGAYFLHGCNGSEAIRRLGYGGKQPGVAASRYLSRPWVQKAISERTKEHERKHDVTVERVAAEYARMAFADAEGAMTFTNKLAALDALAKWRGMFKPETVAIAPVTFQFIGGPVVPDLVDVTPVKDEKDK